METIRISMAAARVNAKMTQDDVAKTMHVSKQTVVNWENGITQPKIEQGEQLSRIYGIPYQNIIFVQKETN